MLNRFIICCLLFLLYSCGDTSSDYFEDINLFGDKGRSSSYEFVSNFPYQIHYQKMIDSGLGAIAPPLVIANDRIILSTDSGQIVSTKFSEIEWKFDLLNNSKAYTPLSSDLMNLYCIDESSNIYSISLFGQLNWSKQLDTLEKFEIYNSIQNNGQNLIITTNKGRLYEIDYSGNIKSKSNSDMSILEPVSSISDFDLITRSWENYNETDTLYAYKNGKVSWKFYENGFRFMKGAVANNNFIAIAAVKRVGDIYLSKLYKLDSNGVILNEKEITELPRFISISKKGAIYIITVNSGFGQMLSGVYKFDENLNQDWKMYYKYLIITPALINEEEIAFLASNRETYGLFFLNNSNGVLKKTLTINDNTPFIKYPAVESSGSIIFVAKDSLKLIKVDQTPLDKILPY